MSNKEYQELILLLTKYASKNKNFKLDNGVFAICCEIFTNHVEFYYLDKDSVSYRDIVLGYCDSLKDVNLIIDELFDVVSYQESKKSARKSMKESKFSLYDLNKQTSFVKDWIRNINKELADVSVESIGDKEVVFRVWFDEGMSLEVFDDIATDYMPRTLIEFIKDMNIDFNFNFVDKEDKFTENGFVFIRFVVW